MANECIPLFRPGQDLSATASATVNGKRFVNWTGYFSLITPSTLPTVAHATAAGLVAGVAAYDAASGSRVAVIRGKGQIVPVTSLGAITAGVEIEVGAGGKATTFSAGVKVGRALSAGTTDADVWIELY